MFLPVSIRQLLNLPHQPELLRDEIIGLDSPLLEITNDRTTLDILRLGCIRHLSSIQPLADPLCDIAISFGYLELVEYLCNAGIVCDEDSCELAAERGYLDILKYLHEQTCESCPWDVQACYVAAQNGHLEVLKYLHENGCPWNEDVAAVAVCCGHIDVVKYIYENGCPINIERCLGVCKAPRLTHILAWLQSL